MGAFRFSYTQRYALWKAYDGRCFYCEEPLGFHELTIDHVLPETLLADLPRLTAIRKEYGIDEVAPGFQINSFTNWVPAHARRCNTKKGISILPKKLLLLCLQEVQKHLPQVKKELENLDRSRARSHALGLLSAAVENKRLSIADVKAFVAELEAAQHAEEPLVMTFSLSMEDLTEYDEIPENLADNYAALCDWLELDLVQHLRSILTTRFHYTEPSERWGDGISVRIVFPDARMSELERFRIPWWKILEASNYWEIFGERYVDAFPDPPEKEYFGELPDVAG